MRQPYAAFAFAILGFTFAFVIAYALRHNPEVRLMDGDEVNWLDSDDNQHTLKATKDSYGVIRGLQYVTYAPKNAPEAIRLRLQRMQEEIENAKDNPPSK